MIQHKIYTTKNLLQPRGANFFLIPLLVISIFIGACKESSLVGLDVQPDGDKLNVSYSDTTTLLAQTQNNAAIRTDETITLEYTTDAILGMYIDPVFGKTTASLTTQMRLNSDAPSFGTNPIIDSVVLALVYDSSLVYGNRIQVAQNINVYELTDSFSTSDNFYATDILPHSSTDLASAYVFTPAPFTPITINGEVLKPQLRIPLQSNFGQTILDKQGATELATNDAFQAFVGGLYITTQNTSGLTSSQGNILRFMMEDTETKLIVYYHNDSESGKNISFSFNSLARFSTFTHDYNAAASALKAQLNSTVLTHHDEVFIQPMGGTRIKIEFPYLMNWNKAKAIGINGAELLLKVNQTYSLDTFAAPNKLIVLAVNADGTTYALDDSNEGAAYFDGTYNAATQTYSINIARYIQQVLSGERANNGLYLSVANETLAPNRVVLGGTSGAYQMKLNITYTQLP